MRPGGQVRDLLVRSRGVVDHDVRQRAVTRRQVLNVERVEAGHRAEREIDRSADRSFDAIHELVPGRRSGRGLAVSDMVPVRVGDRDPGSRPHRGIAGEEFELVCGVAIDHGPLRLPRRFRVEDIAGVRIERARPEPERDGERSVAPR